MSKTIVNKIEPCQNTSKEFVLKNTISKNDDAVKHVTKKRLNK